MGTVIPYTDPEEDEEDYVDSLTRQVYAYEMKSFMSDCWPIKPFNEVFPEFATIEEAKEYVKQHRKQLKE